MPTFDIKVVVEYFYEVEAENETEAEELGWHYEDYAFSGEVYSIDVTQTSDDEEDEDGETED
jgi:hypothetical protein